MKILTNKHAHLPNDIQNLIIKTEGNPEFEKKINILRKEYKRKLTEKEQLCFFKDVEAVQVEFNLPAGWNYPLQSLILKGDFPLMVEDEISLEVEGKNIIMLGGLIAHSRYGVKIVISKRIRKDRLKRWLDEHFEQIEEYFDKLDMKPMDRPRWKNGKLIKRIVQSRNKIDKEGKKTSFGQVTENLKKNDEVYVKTIYHRNKKRFL